MGNLGLSGSFLIGGLLLITLMTIYFRFNSSAESQVINEFTLSNMSSLSDVMDYDFNKIGYRVTAAQKILTISNSSIRFLSDFDNNGAVDTVRYYTHTSNGQLKLVRWLSQYSVKEWDVNINSFNIQGYDSSGTSTFTIANIKSIAVNVVLDNNEFRTDTTDNFGAYYARRYFPKNLN